MSANLQPKRYLLGNAVVVTAVLRDAAGDVVDPSALRLLVAGPAETVSEIVTMTVDGDSATGSFTPDTPGIWGYRVETFSGAVVAAEERTLVIVDRAVPAPI